MTFDAKREYRIEEYRWFGAFNGDSEDEYGVKDMLSKGWEIEQIGTKLEPRLMRDSTKTVADVYYVVYSRERK